MHTYPRDMYTYPRSTEKRESAKTLKHRFAALKGWINRKDVNILKGPRPDADFVEYEGRYIRTKAWYTSPNGRDDADLVRNFMETKTKLKELGEL